jgi:hypothetical protein
MSLQCPKCGHAQRGGEQCGRCGIVFAKYLAWKQEQDAHAADQARISEKAGRAFAQIRGFEVQQRHHLSEALAGVERANRYRVRPQPASATGGDWQIEESNRSAISVLGRNVLGGLYSFAMDLFDENRAKLLHMERRPRLYFHELDVFDENGLHLGRVRRRFSFFNRVISVEDDRGAELLRITGPYWKPWTFLLHHAGREAGMIVKKWSGLLKETWTDADNFSMRFGMTLDGTRKRLLVGAMMLIDSLYFEGRNRFIRHFVSAPGAQIAVLVLAIGLAVQAFSGGRWFGYETPPPAAERDGAAVRRSVFTDLLDRRQPLSALAVGGQYTVVEVYLDSCAVCRRLEAGFPDFTGRRRDTVIRRVHYPEQGIGLTVSATSEQEARRQIDDLRALMDSYQVCGTPHVEVYGPDREPIARDRCTDRSGTQFLRRWMAAESGRSLFELLPGAGGSSSTPLPGGG